MKNGGKLKTENNVYNEACDDGNVDVQSKRQAIGFNLCLFYNDLSSTFFEKGLSNRHSRNSHRHIDGAALSQKVVR